MKHTSTSYVLILDRYDHIKPPEFHYLRSQAKIFIWDVLEITNIIVHLVFADNIEINQAEFKKIIINLHKYHWAIYVLTSIKGKIS